MPRAVVSRGCMLGAAAFEGTQSSKRTINPLVMGSMGNILYTGKADE